MVRVRTIARIAWLRRWVRLGQPRLGVILLNPVRERTEGAVRISRVQLLRNCVSAVEHGTRGFTCTLIGHLMMGLT